jgi:hypothetical protein
LTVEPRAVDPHCFDADPEPDPAQNLDADPDPDPDPGEEEAGQPKMCIPPRKFLGTPLVEAVVIQYRSFNRLFVITISTFPVNFFFIDYKS